MAGGLQDRPLRTLTQRHEQVYARSMFLAGVSLEDKLVLTLAAKLRDAGLDETAERSRPTTGRKVLALSRDARELRRRVPLGHRVPPRQPHPGLLHGPRRGGLHRHGC